MIANPGCGGGGGGGVPDGVVIGVTLGFCVRADGAAVLCCGGVILGGWIGVVTGVGVVCWFNFDFVGLVRRRTTSIHSPFDAEGTVSDDFVDGVDCHGGGMGGYTFGMALCFGSGGNWRKRLSRRLPRRSSAC